MKKTILCTVVAITLFWGISVNVSAEGEAANNETIKAIVSQETADELDQIAAISDSGEIMTYASSSDSNGIYEDNNTRETAYPYEKTKKIEHKDGEYLGHYNCYYAYTRLETVDDVDWFKVNVRLGYRYVAALKNVWTTQERDMVLYFKDSDGTWYSLTAKNKIERQTIFHFMTEADTYFIKISGSPASGCKHDDSTNWFAVEPDGTIDERPHANSAKPSCSL